MKLHSGLRQSLHFTLIPLLFFILSSQTISVALANLQSGAPEEVAAQIDKIVKNKNADSATISALVKLLNNSEKEVLIRERAAWALGQLQAKSAVPALIDASHHKGLLIRSAALDALIRIRSTSALATLTNIAENDPILSLRQRATLGLGLMQNEKAIPALVKLSSDKTPEVQGAAALAMAATHSKKNDFSEVLKEMAAEDDAYVKNRAQKGLEIVRRKNEAVRGHLRSDDSDVRLFAAVYFRERGTSADLESLKQAQNGEADDDVRYEMTRALNAIKKRSAEAKKKAAGEKKP